MGWLLGGAAAEASEAARWSSGRSLAIQIKMEGLAARREEFTRVRDLKSGLLQFVRPNDSFIFE
jgi:hypothetical protein